MSAYTGTIFLYYGFSSWMSYETRIMAIGLVYKEVTVIENMYSRSYNYLALLVSDSDPSSSQLITNFAVSVTRLVVLLLLNIGIAWRLCDCRKSVFQLYRVRVPYDPAPYFESHFEEFEY